MTFDEFQDFVMTHLWKSGDTLVLANLPTVIKAAEHELNRVLKVEDRNRMADAQATSRVLQLPADYRTMLALSSPLKGAMVYVPQQRYATLLVNARANEGFYTIANGELRILGNPSVDNPVDLVMAYYSNIPNFQTTNSSWLADSYFDVYLYCVLKHTAPFLREDERLVTWSALYEAALNSALEENAHERKYAGSPLKMTMTGIA